MYVFAIFAGLLSLVGASIIPSNVLFESLDSVPTGWAKLRVPSLSTRIHLRIALKQSCFDCFEQTLLSVSTPNDARYGQHLTKDEIKSLSKPTEESTIAVLDWLQNSSVPASDIHSDGDWIHFYVSVSKANKMLYTDFYVYGSQDKYEGQRNDKRNCKESNGKDKSMGTTTRAMANDEKIRTLQYSVPPVVAEHILLIQPTTRFGHVKAYSSDIFSTARGPLTDHQQKVNDLPSLSLNTTAYSSSITP